MSPIVLKLGGSVITEKDAPETIDEDALAAAVAAIADRFARDADAAAGPGDAGADGRDGLVVVHGGGSFGHPRAAAHGVSRTEGTRDAAAVRAVHGAMRRLNDAVVSRLGGAGVPAVPVHPLSAGRRCADGDLRYPAEPAATMLREGFVPVLHGDVIAHADAGATVLSGDELVVELAEGLGASRVGLCSTVPGVLDGAGEVVPEISAYDEVADSLGGSESTDVTGGMAAKVRALLDLRAPAAVFGPADLPAFLDGERVGTRIRRD